MIAYSDCLYLSPTLSRCAYCSEAKHDQSHGCNHDLCRLSATPCISYFRQVPGNVTGQPLATPTQSSHSIYLFQTMNLNLKTVAFAAIASFSLLAASTLMSQPAQAEGTRRGQALEQLNLSDAQRTEIEAIRSESRAQMRSVLTSEQQTQLDNSESEGRRIWRQLDLSDSQREEIRTLHTAAREEIQSVLTSEQQAQIEELRELRGRRGERRGAQARQQ